MKLILTQDGSHTIKMPHSNEYYHSKYGAIQESRHVFIEAGLREVARFKSGPIKILEIGFGTGLNALLSEDTGITIEYTAIEPFPISKSLWRNLNYDVASFHECLWEKSVNISPTFELYKTKKTLNKRQVNAPFDLVYFDAFSPETQTEMWTVRIFALLKELLVSTGILVTYCAKGIVKQYLREAGFRVTRLPGPPGKHHMIRAYS